MRVLVTGGAGFIGRYVCRRLLASGHSVRVVDCLVPQVHGDVYDVGEYVRLLGLEQVEFVRKSVALAAIDATVWSDIDAVVHLAAEVGVGQSQYEPENYVRVNTLGTVQMWERVIQRRDMIRRVVVASSMSVYGEGEYDVPGRLERVPARGWDAFDMVWNDGKRTPCDNPEQRLTRESKTPEPASVYARTKYDTEQYSLLLGRTYGVPTLALRFFNVFGPGQALSNPYTGVLAQFACRALNSQPSLIFEDGWQSRDFIYVDDIARAVVAALESDAADQVMNVCTGQRTTVEQLARMWVRIARARGIEAPHPEITQRYRLGDVRHCVGDPAQIQSVLHWKAEVDMETGMNSVADWILQNQIKAVDRTAEALQELEANKLVT